MRWVSFPVLSSFAPLQILAQWQCKPPGSDPGGE
jgi:hypothetical protein